MVIHTWMDDSGYSWFRIQDNGTGMDQDIILNHFPLSCATLVRTASMAFCNSSRIKTPGSL